MTGTGNIAQTPPVGNRNTGEDTFCMNCGGRLDEATGKCPRCDSAGLPPAPRPRDERAGHTSQGTIPPPPPPDTYPPAPSSAPAPPTPGRKIPFKLIAAGLVIIFVVLGISLLAMGMSGNPAVNGNNAGATHANSIPGSGGSSQASGTLPTETVPPNTEVYVQVAKNPLDQEISVVFAGGPGQPVLKELEIRVTRSDGQVLTSNLIPRQQSEATISGTKGNDRVEVFALYYSGQKYRIYDEVLKPRVVV